MIEAARKDLARTGYGTMIAVVEDDGLVSRWIPKRLSSPTTPGTGNSRKLTPRT